MSDQRLSGTFRGLYHLLNPQQRRRCTILATQATVNAVLEAIGAGFILALVAVVTDERGIGDPVGRVIRAVLPDDLSDRTVLLVVAGLTLMFYVVKNISGLLEQYLRQRLVHRTAAEASTDIVSRYLRVPLSMHYLQRSGEMLRNAWSATEQVFRDCLLAALSVLSESLAGLALLIVLFIAAPLATAGVTLTMLAIVALLYRVFRPRIARWGGDLQENALLSLQDVQDSFGAVRDARILGTEDYFVDRYRMSRTALARAFWRSGTVTNASRFVLETAFILSMVVAAVLLSREDQSGTVSLLGLYAYAGLRLMPSLNRIVLALGTMQLSGAALVDVQGALDLPTETTGPGAHIRPKFEHYIDVDGVTFTFPTASRPSVVDVHLRVEQGQAIGIVGPSGAGKSTLVDLIVGLLEPDEGRVLVDGADVRDQLPGWRSSIGYVSQASFLLDDSIRANVAFGIPADEILDDRIWEALRLAQIDELVAGLPDDLAARLGERGVRLSGGQRQRITIARALYRDPKVLVFDEATSALDSRTEDEIGQAVEALARTRTLLIVAHRLTTVRNCDRIVFMDGGVIAAIGTFDELYGENEGFRMFATSAQWTV